MRTLQVELFTESAFFPPVEVRYRRPGQRCPSRALVAGPEDPDLLREKLSAVVGEIVWFEVVSPDPPGPQPPRPSPQPTTPAPAPAAPQQPSPRPAAPTPPPPASPRPVEVPPTPAARLVVLARRLEAARPPTAWSECVADWRERQALAGAAWNTAPPPPTAQAHHSLLKDTNR
jgi:hypothetical protein